MLYVSGCDQITDDGITAIVEKMGKNLMYFSFIHCTKCTGAAFQSIVGHCPKQEQLCDNNVGICKIPHDIGQELPKLESLWLLSNNNIKTLPPSIVLVLNEDLRFDGNPLEDPPLDILNEGSKAMFKYFFNQYLYTLQSSNIAQPTDNLG